MKQQTGKTNKQTETIAKKSRTAMDEKKLQYSVLFLFAAVFVFLPFVVYFYQFENGMARLPWLTTEGISSDLYLYWRMVVFFGIVCIMMCVLGWYLKKQKGFRRKSLEVLDKTKGLWICLATYILLVLLSALYSDYPEYSWHGSVGQFEPAPVLIGYVLAVIFAFFFSGNKKTRELLPVLIAVGACLLSLVGVFQFLGHDPYRTEFIQRLIMPREVYEYSGGIEFSFEENRVYLTLFNPNYAGVYAAFLLPVFISLVLSVHKAWQRLLYAVTVLLLLFVLIGSGSKMGLIVTSLMFIAIVIFHRKKLFHYWWLSIPFFTALVMSVSLLLEYYNPTLIADYIGQLLPQEQTYAIKEIRTTQGGIDICYEDIRFTVVMDISETSLGIGAEREDNVPMEIRETEDPTAFRLVSGGIPDIPAVFYQYGDIPCLSLTIDGNDWMFTNYTEDGQYLYLNPYGTFDLIKNPETTVFTNYPTWISGRGYIWARTLPLLKEYFVLGSGPDTFAMVYPNDDYLGRYYGGSLTEYTSKPHNLYLQIGVQTGTLSMLAIIIVFTGYLFLGLKRYLKSDLQGVDALGSAIFLGIAAYLVMGLINDSSATIAPLFWCILGIGMRCVVEEKSEL